MQRQKVLITGSGGMLGSAFKFEFEKGEYEVRSLSHEELDVTHRSRALDEVSFAPDIVIHTAGIVNADYCEENHDECSSVHVGGTENIIELCVQTGAKLFYPQSFLIFDGKELPITEETKPNPLSVYGEAKLIAEQKILSAIPNALIVRMGGFFGGYEKDKNFVGKFAHFLKKNIKEGTETISGTSRIWQPTSTEHLAQNSRVLIEAGKSGIYNMASHGSASFFDVAKEMVTILKLENRITIAEVPSDYFKEKCVRPENGTMENKRLQKEDMDRMVDWRVSLREYLEKPYFVHLFSDI